MGSTSLDQDTLRTRFAGYVRGEGDAAILQDSPLALRRIGMIGATPQRGQITDYDAMYLERALAEMADMGLPVAPDFEVVYANMDPRYGGLDVLEGGTDFEADVWITCFLPKTDQQYRDFADRFIELGHDNHLYSPHDDNDTAWARAALRNKVKVIVTMGLEREINEDAFLTAGNHFALLRTMGQGKLKSGAVLAHQGYLTELRNTLANVRDFTP